MKIRGPAVVQGCLFCDKSLSCRQYLPLVLGVLATSTGCFRDWYGSETCAKETQRHPFREEQTAKYIFCHCIIAPFYAMSALLPILQ